MAGRQVSIGSLLGLNNRLPPTRMTVTLQDRSTAAWLRSASNVDLTSSGFIRSRQGYARMGEGGYHSLWNDDTAAYGVRDGDLVHIDPRLGFTVAVPAVGSARIVYERLPDGMVYWSNGERIGRLAGALGREIVTPAPNPVPQAVAVAGSLAAGRYQVCFTAVGPDGESPSTEPQQVDLPGGGGIAFSGLELNTRIYAAGPDGEVFNEIDLGDYLSPAAFGAACSTFMLATMPAGRALAHYRGSLLVARGRFLFVSEPYRYGLVHAGRAFIPFPADITVVQPCEDGVYVCADQTYWIPGDPLNTSPVAVLPFGALRGSARYETDEKAAYWQGPQGVVVAKPGGVVAAPQDAALTFTSASTGATLVRERDGEKHVIAVRQNVEPT